MKKSNALSKPVKMKTELSGLVGASELSRTEITKKFWEYIKGKGLQTKTVNGEPTNSGKFIVADETLLPIFQKTNSVTKSGKKVDFTSLKLGETIDMMQIGSVISANIDS